MEISLKNTIIAQAIGLGFDFEVFAEDMTLEELSEELRSFFAENSEKLPQREDEAEVINNGTTQHVSYMNYDADGEIVNFSDHWDKDPETKVYHSDFVMEDEKEGIMVNMNLYYYVGETDYNAPPGYYYSKRLKRHVKDE